MKHTLTIFAALLFAHLGTGDGLKSAQCHFPVDHFKLITFTGGIAKSSVNPPWGGTSDDKWIVHPAAPGGKAVIKGSEIIKGWEKVQDRKKEERRESCARPI